MVTRLQYTSDRSRRITEQPQKKSFWGGVGNVLGKAVDVISTPLYGMIGAGRGIARGDWNIPQTFGQGVREKQNWYNVADDLKLQGIPRHIVGTGGNFFLDPMNAVGAGLAAKVIRGADKGADALKLSQAGNKVFKQVTAELMSGLGKADDVSSVTRQAAKLGSTLGRREQIMNEAYQIMKGKTAANPRLLARGGVVFQPTGHTLIPKEVFSVPAKAVWSAGKKIPIVGSILKKTEQLANDVGKLFTTRLRNTKADEARELARMEKGAAQILSTKVAREFGDMSLPPEKMNEALDILQDRTGSWFDEAGTLISDPASVITKTVDKADDTLKGYKASFGKQFKVKPFDGPSLFTTYADTVLDEAAPIAQLIKDPGKYSWNEAEYMFDLLDPNPVPLTPAKMQFIQAKAKEIEAGLRNGVFTAEDHFNLLDMVSTLRKAGEETVIRDIGSYEKLLRETGSLFGQHYQHAKDTIKGTLKEYESVWATMADLAKQNISINGMPKVMRRVVKDPEVIALVQKSRKLFDELINAELAEGIMTPRRAGYLPHILENPTSPEALEFVNLASDPGFTRSQMLQGTIQEINKRAGKDLLATDLAKLAAIRTYKSKTAIAQHRYLQTLLSLGKEIGPEDLDGYVLKADEAFYTLKPGQKFNLKVDTELDEVLGLGADDAISVTAKADKAVDATYDAEKSYDAWLGKGGGSDAMYEDWKMTQAVESGTTKDVMDMTGAELQSLGKSAKQVAERQVTDGGLGIKAGSQEDMMKQLEAMLKDNAQTNSMSKAKTVDITQSSKKSPYFQKDVDKFSRATKLISRGSPSSSSAAYATAAGELSNTGKYSASDIVGISAEGNRASRIAPDFEEINKAIQANASFITDIPKDRLRPYNVGEREVAQTLVDAGYKEVTPGFWKHETIEAPPVQVSLTPKVKEIPTNSPDLPTTKATIAEKVVETAKKADGPRTFVIPREVADHLKTYEKRMRDPGTMEQVLKEYFDPLQNFWKGWVMGTTPGTAMRNMVGNLWNNWLAGTKGRNYVTATDLLNHIDDPEYLRTKIIKTAYGNMTGEELIEDFVKGGILDKGFYGADINTGLDAIDTFTDTKIRNAGDLFSPRKNPLPRAIFKGQTYIENLGYLAHYIGKVEDGYNPFDAILSVKKYLFDYSDLTEVERKVLKRLMPFYTFTRKNIPLQLERLLASPTKYSAIAKMKWMMQEIAPEDDNRFQYLPEWLKSPMAIRLPWKDREGKDLYIDFTDWIPAGQLNMLDDPIKDIGVQMSSPLLKAPVEMALNYNSYYGEPISKYPGQREKLLGVSVDKKLAYFMKQFRLANEMNRLVAYETPDSKKSPEERLGRYLTGLRLDRYDWKKSQYVETKKGKSTMRDAIKRDLYLAKESGDEDMQRYLQEMLNGLR